MKLPHTKTTHERAGTSYLVVGLCFGLLLYVGYVLAGLDVVHGQINVAADGAVPLSLRLSFLLVCSNIFLSTAIVTIAMKKLVYKHLSSLGDLLILLGTLWGGGLLALLYSYQPLLLSGILLLSTVLLVVAKLRFRNYSFAGVNLYLAFFVAVIVGVAWWAGFFTSLHISLATRVIILGTMPLVLIMLPSDLVQMFEQYDIICREHWKRPKHPFPDRVHTHEPVVSLHVPTYSEPPAVVIDTLNRLAALRYDNYEVIVIDNNTKDARLWWPVREHCEKLGEKFRFIHVEGIKGAKGGALNYALKHTRPDATVIGVVDADYHAEPDFLQALVGYFDDPAIGFVQTPHDYRGWRGNLFLTMCYWEYKIYFHTAMISLSERDAGITVGTMCLIRKEALQRAGGWSEWCVTEDSELAIRIHDVGYSSVYVDRTYGRGLIPDTFEGYKKQRYRWTAGPVQEFRHYARHFVGLSKKPSKFTLIQRIFHLNHGLHNVFMGTELPLTAVGVLLAASLVVHHEIIPVPFELWLSATVMLLASPLLTFLLYRATIKPTMLEIAGHLFAGRALSHVIRYSALRTFITGSAAWNRTSKFKSAYSYAAALYTTREELLAGAALLLFIIGAYAYFPYAGFSLMVLIGLSYYCFNYFAAPLMSIIGVWSMKRSHQLRSGIKPEVMSAPSLSH